VIFQVYGDGNLLFASSVMRTTTPTQTIDIDVTGVQELRLVVTDAGDGKTADHADWANARLLSQQSAAQIKVNFQLESAPLPAGYLKDGGHIFGIRLNGQSYGWSSDHTDVSRDRNLNSEQRLDTVVQFHAGQHWEIALPNGIYAVTVSTGDSGFESTHTLNVEGQSFWNGQQLATNQFEQMTRMVTVQDGRLTLGNGTSPEKATRINYVEIVPLGQSMGLLPLASADLTLNGKFTYADVLAFAAGWGNHSETLSLQGLVEAGDLNFDRVTDNSDWALFSPSWAAAGMPAISLSAVLDPVHGDFDRNGSVDDSDLTLWRNSFGKTIELAADGNENGLVDAADYTIWRNNLGATGPTPGTNALAAKQLEESSKTDLTPRDRIHVAYSVTPHLITHNPFISVTNLFNRESMSVYELGPSLVDAVINHHIERLLNLYYRGSVNELVDDLTSADPFDSAPEPDDIDYDFEVAVDLVLQMAERRMVFGNSLLR
jgi:hypothetical protein